MLEAATEKSRKITGVEDTDRGFVLYSEIDMHRTINTPV